MMPKTKDLTSTSPLSNLALYCSLVGILQYLTLIQLDLSLSVNFISQFMHSLTEAHFKMVKRSLRYVKGTVTFGLHFISKFCT